MLGPDNRCPGDEKREGKGGKEGITQILMSVCLSVNDPTQRDTSRHALTETRVRDRSFGPALLFTPINSSVHSVSRTPVSQTICKRMREERRDGNQGQMKNDNTPVSLCLSRPSFTQFAQVTGASDCVDSFSAFLFPLQVQRLTPEESGETTVSHK